MNDRLCKKARCSHHRLITENFQTWANCLKHNKPVVEIETCEEVLNANIQL